ncbi:hypothetical protein [Pseudoxanthomonas sp.]|uniref:hypothetical protein n=1 Tax=Pseudoxanthomonas sp. TaxID=1871049 RepID=UPI002585A098|nr:hypothetical protein [Pseudoxanthomonas sp.]MCR6686732.1 hypothetical protein [Pseudoxanthomonas sp.]
MGDDELMRALLLTTLAAMTGAAPGAITSVTVRDADFAQVKALGPDELDAFARMWASKRRVDRAQAGDGTHYKLDIGAEGWSQRYLYYSSGLLTLLAKDVQPVYEVADPVAFNRLIGAAE